MSKSDNAQSSWARAVEFYFSTAFLLSLPIMMALSKPPPNGSEKPGILLQLLFSSAGGLLLASPILAVAVPICLIKDFKRRKNQESLGLMIQKPDTPIERFDIWLISTSPKIAYFMIFCEHTIRFTDLKSRQTFCFDPKVGDMRLKSKASWFSGCHIELLTSQGNIMVFRIDSQVYNFVTRWAKERGIKI